jgi:hypothetical protein
MRGSSIVGRLFGSALSVSRDGNAGILGIAANQRQPRLRTEKRNALANASAAHRTNHQEKFGRRSAGGHPRVEKPLMHGHPSSVKAFFTTKARREHKSPEEGPRIRAPRPKIGTSDLDHFRSTLFYLSCFTWCLGVLVVHLLFSRMSPRLAVAIARRTSHAWNRIAQSTRRST